MSSLRRRFESLSPLNRLTLLAIPVGFITGIGAWLFKTLIEIIFNISILTPVNWLMDNGFGSLAWIPFLISPMIGALFVGLIGRVTPPESKGHGIPNIITAINQKGGKIHPSVPLIKLATASLTIGSGGTGGVEGPIAQIGAGWGSSLGQKLNLTTKDLRVLVLAGVSAGISSIFNAPIGGIFFAIEVVKRRSNINTFGPLIVASIIGATVCHLIYGQEPTFGVFPDIAYENLWQIPSFILMGVCAGLLSVAWIKLFYGVEHRFHQGFSRFKIPNFIQPVIGAAGVGVCSIIIFILFKEDWEMFSIIGATHTPMTNLFEGTLDYSNMALMLGILLLIFFLKMVSTALCIGSGGSGGLFMPTLFMGVFFGVVFGILISILFNLPPDSLSLYALVGMASFFAGTIRAPITAIIIAAEITGDYLLTIPLMFGVIFSMIVSTAIEKDDLYTKQLTNQGVVLAENFSEVMDVILVKDAMVPREKIISVKTTDTARSVLLIAQETGHEGFPIFDGNHMVGVVTIVDLLQLKERMNTATILDILDMKKRKMLVSVTPDSSLNHAYSIMLYYSVSRLPVVEKQPNNNFKLVGWLTTHDFEEINKKNHPIVDLTDIKAHSILFGGENNNNPMPE